MTPGQIDTRAPGETPLRGPPLEGGWGGERDTKGHVAEILQNLRAWWSSLVMRHLWSPAATTGVVIGNAPPPAVLSLVTHGLRSRSVEAALRSPLVVHDLKHTGNNTSLHDAYESLRSTILVYTTHTSHYGRQH